jgi:phosphoribosyl 1,2-cyclic phosphodiesterase
MSLQLASLNSGSNANCYYVGNGKNAVLIDAGLSGRETEKRMERLGLDIRSVDALFITHEHHDHVSGLPSLIKKFRWPVYLTEGTLQHLPVPIDTAYARIICSDQETAIGTLNVLSFPKNHDAADPISIVVSCGVLRVGVMTDIGHCCKEVKRHFEECHAVFLESNYCEDMLASGNYPESLKRRISGKKGHLSNDQALELFIKHRSPSLQHLILSHLSRNNNTHEKAKGTFIDHTGKTALMVASRYKESPLITISGDDLPSATKKGKGNNGNITQLRLF